MRRKKGIAKQVWEKAGQIEDGNGLRVTYESSRGKKKLKEMTGKVTEIDYDNVNDRLSIFIERDDGQKLEVQDDGWLYSIGSNFPRTGQVMNLTIIENEEGEKFGGIPG